MELPWMSSFFNPVWYTNPISLFHNYTAGISHVDGYGGHPFTFWSRYTSTSHIIQSWYSMVIHLHFHSMGLFLYREILCYPTPINFNYWYGIGLLLVFLLVNQVLTGIQVGSYYIVSIDVALSSVDYLMREITYGWSFRYLHSNGAYWIFTLVYVHLWRGI